MRISFFAAALMVAGFCVSAQNPIELKRIPSGLRLKEGKVLFDASSPLNKTVFRQGRNVRMEQSGNRNVLVSGKPAKVISWTVSTLDPSFPGLFPLWTPPIGKAAITMCWETSALTMRESGGP